MTIAADVRVKLKRKLAVTAPANARMEVTANAQVGISMVNVPAVMDIAVIIDYEKGLFTCGMLGVNVGLRWKWAV